MPFVTFQGECSVDELADRLFARLTPKQRAAATAALIRANPRLERIEAVPKGTLLHVPDIPALRAKATASNESPDRQVLQLIDESTRAYAERLLDRQASDEAEIKKQAATIKSAQFTKAISKSKDLVALAEQARASLEARAKSAGERRKALETAVGKASADIEARMKRN